MSRPLARPILLGLLLLLGAGLLGAGSCHGGASHDAAVVFVPGSLTLASGETALVDVVLALDETTTVQALELDLAAELPSVAIDRLDPHPDFDDDGVWLLPPRLRFLKGLAEDAVDLRHGAAAGGPQLGLARVTVRAITPGEGHVRVSGGRLADPQGREVPVSRATLQVTVTP